jgi:RNA polymerase sigma factor (sigma-70 family)
MEISIDSLLRKYYADGVKCHGDLHLSFVNFSSHIRSIVSKYCELYSANYTTTRFVDSLYFNDLYLSIACTGGSESAWERFTGLYKQLIFTWAYFACEGRDFVDELAQGVLTDLYLPDQSGSSRIASYDGRSSLTSWLQAIVKYRALNEQKRKDNTLLSLDSVPAKKDVTFFEKLNSSVRAGQYESIVKDSFNAAVSSLTHREKFILLLRYEKGIQSTEIARSFCVSPSAISRQIHAICRKLREGIISTLINSHRLNETALNECIADIMENPAYSILELIKAE